MESFTYTFEDAEEFSSNESGWTKYIASPPREENLGSKVDDDGGDADDDVGDDHAASRKRDDNDTNDDDSFASDASSGPRPGPSHFAEISEDGCASCYSTKHAAGDDECCQFYSGKKGGETKDGKETSGRVAKEVRRNESIFKGNKPTGYVLKQKQGNKNKHDEK